MKADILAQQSIRRLRPETKGKTEESCLKGCRPLPKFQSLSSVVEEDFINFLKKEEIRFIDALVITDFLLHFELVSFERKLVEGKIFNHKIW